MVKKQKKEFFPMQPGDIYQTYVDVAELEKGFDFKPATSLRDGLNRFAEWFLISNLHGVHDDVF